MIFGIALASVFIIQGLRITSRFVFLLFQWKKSQEWPAIKGVISKSNLQSVLVPRGGKKSHNIDGSVRLVTAYSPDIVYEYRVNAVSFQSKQLFIGQQFPLPFDITNRFVEKYPTGKEVAVYYDPDKPEFAVLERDKLKEIMKYLASGIISLIVGFLILIQAIDN